MPLTAAVLSSDTESQQETPTAFFESADTHSGPTAPPRAPALAVSLVAAPTAFDVTTRSEFLTGDVVGSSDVAAKTPFTLLQRWEGVVVEPPTADDFVAMLRDLTKPLLAEERGTFSLDQVPLPDRSLVVAGAVFYWSIGYEDLPTGTRRTTSVIRFRRLPAWSKNDMRRIREGVERLRDIARDFE